MPVFNPQKSISPTAITCQETAAVTISFDASAALSTAPADIVLIMDRSYSMNLQRMGAAKRGARSLIQMVAAASAGDSDGDLADTRMGIVSFSNTATADTALTTETTPLKIAISRLNASGNTNHSAAFEMAEILLGPKGANRQVVIMFTDGLTTVGGDANPITDRMKAAGVEIYCIGLVDDPLLMNQWASEPIAEHVAFTSDPKQLEALFQRVASRVVLVGAQNAVIRETVSPDFKITAVSTPTFGTAKLIGDQDLIWTMEYAGVNLNAEAYSLTFEIQHIGSGGGSKAFNQSIVYEDQAGTQLQFPGPTVEVSCPGIPVYPEPYPDPTEFAVPGCQDTARIALGNVVLQGLGRVVQLDVTLQAVCPGKRVAASVMLMETAVDGSELPRGVKHFLIPAQEGTACRDLTLKCVQFSLPEALDADGQTASICNPRKFSARVIANYVDTDFTFCPPLTQTI